MKINAFILGLYLISVGAQRQTHNSGLIFTDLGRAYASYTHWHICFYYDLEPYYLQLQHLAEGIDKMRTICQNINSNALCLSIVEQLDSHFEDARVDKDKIESFQQSGLPKIVREKRELVKYRNKREIDQREAPFEFLGRIQNALFGVLDSRTARDYDEKIERLQKNESLMNEFVTEQTTIIRNSIDLNKETFDSFKRNIEELGNEIVKLGKISENTILDVVNKMKIQAMAQIALAIIVQHNKISEELMDLLQSSIQGKISNEIPIGELKQVYPSAWYPSRFGIFILPY